MQDFFQIFVNFEWKAVLMVFDTRKHTSFRWLSHGSGKWLSELNTFSSTTGKTYGLKLGGQVTAMKWNIHEKYGAFVRNWTFHGNKHSDNWLLTL